MAETQEDELLVQQFNRGDISAFERIVEQYWCEIAVLANRLLGWPSDVEDITQDVFVAAFLGLKKFRCECSLRTWLFTIAINKCRSSGYRRVLRLRRRWWARDEMPVGGYESADKGLMDGETFGRVRRAVRALPGKYREAVVLRYLQELGTDEICRMLGISVNALEVRLHRARHRLK